MLNNRIMIYTANGDFLSLIMAVGFIAIFIALVVVIAVIVKFKKELLNSKEVKNTGINSYDNTNSLTSRNSENELVAVLTAAVAASLDAPASKFKIKSYRKLGMTNSIWNNASRNENIYGKLN